MTTPTVQTAVRPKLHDAVVATRSDWKFCRVFGRHQNGEPLDIMVEPKIGGVMISSVDHKKDPITELYFCANGVKSVSNITAALRPAIGDEFSFNTDGLRQIRVRPETPDAERKIEELISMLTRDSQ
jgi:hypothetical protein